MLVEEEGTGGAVDSGDDGNYLVAEKLMGILLKVQVWSSHTRSEAIGVVFRMCLTRNLPVYRFWFWQLLLARWLASTMQKGLLRSC